MKEMAMRSGYMIVAVSLLFFCSHQVMAQEEIVDEADYNASQQYLSNGWDQIEREKFEAAVDFFNQSIQKFNGNTDAFVGKATALMRLDRLEEAEKSLEKAIELSPGGSDIYFLAGNIYFKMEYFEKASRNYTQAIEKNDESEIPVDEAKLHYNRGNAFFQAGMYRSAINDFSKVIAQQSQNMHAYHNRALAYKHKQDFENACKDFETAKTLGSLMSDKFIERYCQ